MKARKYRFGACHYCVCTACSRFECPWEHKLYRECFACRQRGYNSPRLDCDSFSHYRKKFRYKFKRVHSVPDHFGTYILHTKYGVMIGKYEQLIKLKELVGGKLEPMNILDYRVIDD